MKREKTASEQLIDLYKYQQEELQNQAASRSTLSELEQEQLDRKIQS